MIGDLGSFVHAAGPVRIVFGRGAQALVPQEIERLAIARVLIITTPQQADQGSELLSALGSTAAGLYSGATMHTPVEITEKAVSTLKALNADGVVTLGGGSTTGLGKAISARTGVPHIAVPTTYAGSEVTPVLGETQDGVKRTRSGPDILPETVIYDPSLTDALPLPISIASGLNAMAHALEGLYARDRSPIFRLLAIEGLRAFQYALPRLRCNPQDAGARDKGLYAAWMCGTVLGGVGMSIHHKLCHTLGGALNLPHAETHAILLPHTVGYVANVAHDELAPATELFGSPLGSCLHDFASSINAPQRLSDLGVRESDLADVADLAMESAYWSPVPLEREGLHQLLHDAWSGDRPTN